jgi:hypothetical protein
MAKDKVPQKFCEYVEELGHGEIHRELSERLLEVTQSIRDITVSERGKVKGELTLKLSFTGEGSGMQVKGEIKIKKPKFELGTAYMFIDDETGHQVSEEPRQQKLKLGNEGVQRGMREGPEERPLRSV